MTSQDFAQYITTGLDIYGKYKEITEYPTYAREVEALKVQLAETEAEIARTKAVKLRNILVYGGLSVAAIVVIMLILKKRRK